MTARSNIMLLFLAVLVGLAAAETGLRLAGIGGYRDDPLAEHVFNRYHPQLGWDLMPDQAEVPTNSQGIRSPREFSPAKPPGVTRVALMGDSVAFGLNVKYESTLAAKLEQEGAGLEALNFGVPGYGTDQALIKYRIVARKFGPDCVVIGVSLLNDVGNNCYALQYGAAKPCFRLRDGVCALHDLPGSRRRHELDLRLRRASRFYNLARSAQIEWQTRRQMDRFSYDSADARFQEGLRLTTVLLETFIDEVRKDGAVPILLVLPYRVLFVQRAEFRHPLYRAAVEISRKKDVPLIDGSKILARDQAWDKRAFVEGYHLSDYGAQLIGREIAQVIGK